MKYNLGSNDVRHEGFINVDIRPANGVDIVDDVTTLEKIEDNSAEEIYAHNVLEHIFPDKMDKTLALWVRKLKPGGYITIGVPDSEGVFLRYLKEKEWHPTLVQQVWERAVHGIFGNFGLLREWHGEDAEKYGHHMMFSKDYLKSKMEEAGLENIVGALQTHPECFSLRGEKPNV
jgi:predicted SAM-dependent methyltransferase